MNIDEWSWTLTESWSRVHELWPVVNWWIHDFPTIKWTQHYLCSKPWKRRIIFKTEVDYFLVYYEYTSQATYHAYWDEYLFIMMLEYYVGCLFLHLNVFIRTFWWRYIWSSDIIEAWYTLVWHLWKICPVHLPAELHLMNCELVNCHHYSAQHPPRPLICRIREWTWMVTYLLYYVW